MIVIEYASIEAGPSSGDMGISASALKIEEHRTMKKAADDAAAFNHTHLETRSVSIPALFRGNIAAFSALRRGSRFAGGLIRSAAFRSIALNPPRTARPAGTTHRGIRGLGALSRLFGRSGTVSVRMMPVHLALGRRLPATVGGGLMLAHGNLGRHALDDRLGAGTVVRLRPGLSLLRGIGALGAILGLLALILVFVVEIVAAVTVVAYLLDRHLRLRRKDDAVIVFGMLEIVLSHDTVARTLRVAG